MEEKLNKLGEVCFWIAFVTELIVVIIDKSAYTNPYESWIFRITFMLFTIKAATTKYTRKDIVIILICGLISVISYFVNTRDEVVRIAVFVISCKDIDLRKMLNVTFVVTGIGAIILFILSATGIFGVFSITGNFGRGETADPIIETRYCFGMGHPNAFQTMLFMMTSLVLYLYFDRIKLYHFAVLEIVNIFFFLFTDSKTGILVVTALIWGVAFVKYCKPIANKKALYIIAGLIVIGIVAFSAYGSHVGGGEYLSFMCYLDGYLNGRFRSAHMIEEARIENWKLFAMSGNEEYFDQGFIRLFYWYGIIPGLLYVASNVYLIWQSYKNKDYPLAVIIVAYAILSVTEAHLISIYMLRNYILIWLGYYWYRAFTKDGDSERYLWRINRFLKGGH